MKKSIFILLWSFCSPLFAQKAVKIDSSFQKNEFIDLSEQTLFLLDSSKQKTIGDIRKVNFKISKNYQTLIILQGIRPTFG